MSLRRDIQLPDNALGTSPGEGAGKANGAHTVQKMADHDATVKRKFRLTSGACGPGTELTLA